MTKNHNYWAFGLNILSELAFPELVAMPFVEPNLVIKNGIAPSELKNTPLLNTNTTKANKQEFLFIVPHVCTYYACNGNSIIVEAYPSIDERSVRLYLLATVMAAILHQGNAIPIHASALIINRKLTLITGNSGVGKSTSMAQLHKKGYTIFSDDVVVVQVDRNDEILAFSSYPMLKLWEDAIVTLNDKEYDKLTFAVKPNLNKYGFFFHEKFDKNNYPIDTIFIIKLKETGDIETRVLENAEAFREFNMQSYRPYLLHTNELRQLNFTILLGIIQKAIVIEVKRPKKCNIDDLVMTLENAILERNFNTIKINK